MKDSMSKSNNSVEYKTVLEAVVFIVFYVLPSLFVIQGCMQDLSEISNIVSSGNYTSTQLYDRVIKSLTDLIIRIVILGIMFKMGDVIMMHIHHK